MIGKLKEIIKKLKFLLTKKLIARRFYYNRYKNITSFIKKRPMTSFFITLLLLLAVIIIGGVISAPKKTSPPQSPVKTIHIYNIGEAPAITYQAKVEKKGVIKITALSGGVVQKINVKEGDFVEKGDQIVSLATNYQGGNAPALQAQIAETQYQNVLDTFQKQEDLIGNQRDIANKTSENAAQLRAIQQQSIDETNNLINSNQGVLDTLRQNAEQGGQQNDPQIQGQINQLQAAQNQLREAFRNTQYQASDTNLPAQLSNLQIDATGKQLDLQEKMFVLNKEVSRLQAAIAEVIAATMFPAAPFSGTVQRVYVRIGQQVTPGTVLAEISSNDQNATAIANVPGDIANNISLLETSRLHIGKFTYNVRPTFISKDATDGQLYSVIFALPDNIDAPVSDGEYLRVDIPVGSSNTSAAVPFVPLDAVYQTQDKNYLLVVKNKKAVVREVTLGTIFGNFVEITSGLRSGDQVILDRNVVAGDRVTTN